MRVKFGENGNTRLYRCRGGAYDDEAKKIQKAGRKKGVAAKHQ